MNLYECPSYFLNFHLPIVAFWQQAHKELKIKDKYVWVLIQEVDKCRRKETWELNLEENIKHYLFCCFIFYIYDKL